jgi:hypothetical protein
VGALEIVDIGLAFPHQDDLGYPVSLAQLPAGDYYAQAIVNVYEPIKRTDGKTIWVHFNDGSQEVMQIAEGNVYSEAQKIHVGSGGTVSFGSTRSFRHRPSRRTPSG